ncbi:hypothetical protein [Deinococcus apachensis]|uniref:hypothetical protein n=1 Tax=Deinococcus apachensis TaxID=309886 RepID=UPI0003791C49|nr:hypothetical protein [Deinococcus apachensis]
MKKLVIAALLLSSCAPSLQLAQRESASLARDAQAVVFKNPGETTAQVPTVFLRGAGLKVSAVNEGVEVCRERDRPGLWGCNLPDVPGGKLFRISVTAGAVESGNVTFYREASGARPIFLPLE